MEIKGKVHCFFEQSGTFKNEFIKLGIPAEDYDIQNNFGETDHTDDIFKAINDAYDGKPSLFDNISPEDLIIAFFPCIRFCNIAEYNQRSAQEKWRKDGMPVEEIYRKLKKASDERYEFYQLALKMHAVVEIRGLRLIMENPWNETNYTNYFWFSKPSIIDKDRTRRGDYFVKPTAYWFTGCTPTHGETIQPTPIEKRMVTSIGSWSKKPANNKFKKAKGSKKRGLCSEERSLISPDYARNFICDFILGKERQNSQLTLF
jgi:hypothetical protein